MTTDELSTFAFDLFAATGGSDWPRDLELGLWSLAIAGAAVALVLALAAMREGGR